MENIFKTEGEYLYYTPSDDNITIAVKFADGINTDLLIAYEVINGIMEEIIIEEIEKGKQKFANAILKDFAMRVYMTFYK